MEETIAQCDLLIKMRNKQHVVINAAKVVTASESEELREIINSCDLVNADGMAVVWASKLLRNPLPERVAGIDLMNNLVTHAVERNLRIYLLGAEEEVSMKVAEVFSQRGASIVGRRNGFWTDAQETAVVSEISKTNPDLLFIAVPSPKKEYFLKTHLLNLNCGLVVGVGGSFDVVAGKTRRAPKFMQVTGMEWFYRLIQEPRRMLKRYAVGNSKFILLVFSELLRRKKSATK
ncbi:MAG: glycosyltransferase [Actinobacteria bacterium]|nr:glycosyltransferase [Actinomycetota bacterium]